MVFFIPSCEREHDRTCHRLRSHIARLPSSRSVCSPRRSPVSDEAPAPDPRRTPPVGRDFPQCTSALLYNQSRLVDGPTQELSPQCRHRPRGAAPEGSKYGRKEASPQVSHGTVSRDAPRHCRWSCERLCSIVLFSGFSAAPSPAAIALRPAFRACGVLVVAPRPAVRCATRCV